MLEIKANSQSVKELNKELDILKKNVDDIDGSELKDLDKSVNDINASTKSTVKTITSLEDTLKSLNEELYNTEIGTKAYKDLQKQVIATSGELKNLELAREALDNEQFASEAKSVAGGLGDVAGGLVLIGASSGSVEKIVQTIAQVEGITKAATGAIEAYSSGVKIVNSLVSKGAAVQKLLAGATVVQTTATGASTAATAGATTTQLGLNAAMLANPIFLLIAGIAALVAAFVIFGDSTVSVKESNEELNRVLEEQIGISDRLSDKRIKNAENNLALLRAQGAGAKELLDAEVAVLDEKEQARLLDIQNAKKSYDLNLIDFNKAIADEDQEQVKAIREKLKKEKLKLAELRNLNGQYQVDKNILETQFNTNEANEDTKTNEETIKRGQDAYKKRLADQEKYNQDRLNAARKIKDLELSLLEEGERRDSQIAAEKTKREIEDLNSQYGDVKKLNETQLAELNTLRKLIRERGDADIKKISDKFRAEELADNKAFSDELTKLIGTEGTTKKELLDIQYDSELASLKERLDKELISIEQSNILKAQLQSNLHRDKAKIDAEYAAKEKAARLELEATDLDGKLAKLQGDRDLELENKDLTESEKLLIDQTYHDSRLGLIEEEKAAKISAAQEAAAAIGQGLDLVAGLVNASFDNEQAKRDTKHAEELSNLTEGTVEYANAKARQVSEDDKAAKKQFEINKKVQIAQAIIQGVQATLAAYSSGSAIPIVGAVTGPLFAALAAAVSIKNISKIKNSSYQGSGGGGGDTGGGSAPTIPTSITPAQPSFGLFGHGNDANTVGPGADNNNQNITVNSTVSVSEINEVQNTVAVQEERSSL